MKIGYNILLPISINSIQYYPMHDIIVTSLWMMN